MFKTKVRLLVISTDLFYVITFLLIKWAILEEVSLDLIFTKIWIVGTDKGPKIKFLWWHLVQISNTKCHQVHYIDLGYKMWINMTSVLHFYFIHFMWRNHKNVRSNWVSDFAGMNQRLGPESALCVKCTKVWWCSVANLEQHAAAECGAGLRRSYIPIV